MLTIRNNLCHGRPSVTFTFKIDINPDVVEATKTDEELRNDIIERCVNAYKKDLYLFLKEGYINE